MYSFIVRWLVCIYSDRSMLVLQNENLFDILYRDYCYGNIFRGTPCHEDMIWLLCILFRTLMMQFLCGMLLLYWPTHHVWQVYPSFDFLLVAIPLEMVELPPLDCLHGCRCGHEYWSCRAGGYIISGFGGEPSNRSGAPVQFTGKATRVLTVCSSISLILWVLIVFFGFCNVKSEISMLKCDILTVVRYDLPHVALPPYFWV